MKQILPGPKNPKIWHQNTLKKLTYVVLGSIFYVFFQNFNHKILDKEWRGGVEWEGITLFHNLDIVIIIILKKWNRKSNLRLKHIKLQRSWVGRASATDRVWFDSQCGQNKEIRKIGISSFSAWRSAIQGTVWRFYHVVDRWARGSLTRVAASWPRQLGEQTWNNNSNFYSL